MAQINLTLNQEEIQALLLKDHDNAFKSLLEACLNKILKAESDEQLGAEKYERTDERKGYRNGSRERTLNTRLGRITLQVPRHREHLSFTNFCTKIPL